MAWERQLLENHATLLYAVFRQHGTYNHGLLRGFHRPSNLLACVERLKHGRSTSTIICKGSIMCPNTTAKLLLHVLYECSQKYSFGKFANGEGLCYRTEVKIRCQIHSAFVAVGDGQSSALSKVHDIQHIRPSHREKWTAAVTVFLTFLNFLSIHHGRLERDCCSRCNLRRFKYSCSLWTPT